MMSEIAAQSGQHDILDENQYRLYNYAEKTLEDPATRERYDKFHWYYVGPKDAERRNNNENPFIHRPTNQGDRVYTIPVFNGFDAESGRLLHISHDHWVSPDDETSWFVAEGSLNDDRVEEYHIHHPQIDNIGRVVLGLIEQADYQNWPDNYHPQIHSPTYNQNRIITRVDQDYHAMKAEYIGGQYGRRTSFETIDVLNGMRRVILEKKFAEFEFNFSESKLQPLDDRLEQI